MRMKLIYPKWRKLERQTPFYLPPHGPVVFAAALPDWVDLDFTDQNVDEVDLDDTPDIVGLSIMLTAQMPKALELAEYYRKRGIPVIAGGISAALHKDYLVERVDSVFVGEVEGRMEQVFNDLIKGELQPIYNYHLDFPDTEIIGPARREILNYERYQYRGVKMLDLVHASRGCRFNCFPCCTPFLGGRQFRPRPIERVVEEVQSINNNRLFFVDNSLAQNDQWEEELFTALIPLKKKWVSHPIKNNDHLLDLAYKAGAWYVYQAVFDTSDYIKRRIQNYKDHGIEVEATVILGTDDQDVDYIKRLVDFLMEIDIGTAEFTILTPYWGTPIRAQLLKEGRIFNHDFANYTTDRVVYQPKNMTPTELQDMFYYAWDTFYAHETQEFKMGRLFQKLVKREIEDGTYIRPSIDAAGRRRRRAS